MYNLEIINRVGGATSIRIHESYINSTLSFNPLNSKVSLSKSSISPFPINFKREETIRLSKEEIHISKNRGVAVSHSWGGGGRVIFISTKTFDPTFAPKCNETFNPTSFTVSTWNLSTACTGSEFAISNRRQRRGYHYPY